MAQLWHIHVAQAAALLIATWLPAIGQAAVYGEKVSQVHE